MKQTKLVALFAAVVAHAVPAMAVENGVHGYTPKGYVEPTEPEVRERLEWFRDQKLAAARLVHVASGREFPCEGNGDGVCFDLPSDFVSDECADVFRISNSK